MGSEPTPSAAPLDAAEEFQKVQRGLRRLSLASDRSAEVLQAVSARLDEMRETLVNVGRRQGVALALDEPRLLRVLDQLDRAADAAHLSSTIAALIESARSELLAAAGWRSLAAVGGEPSGTDIRVAEFAGSREGDAADVRIHRILEQGYRRSDGSLLRPAVVIVAAASACSSADVST